MPKCLVIGKRSMMGWSILVDFNFFFLFLGAKFAKFQKKKKKILKKILLKF